MECCKQYIIVSNTWGNRIDFYCIFDQQSNKILHYIIHIHWLIELCSFILVEVLNNMNFLKQILEYRSYISLIEYNYCSYVYEYGRFHWLILILFRMLNIDYLFYWYIHRSNFFSNKDHCNRVLEHILSMSLNCYMHYSNRHYQNWHYRLHHYSNIHINRLNIVD